MFAILPVVLLLSSCMVMAPGHLTQSVSQTNLENDETTVYIDPVCGDEIVNDPTEFSYRYNDQIYYFHTVNCKNRFVKAPAKYIYSDHPIKSHHTNNALFGMGGIAMGVMMLIMLI